MNSGISALLFSTAFSTASSQLGNRIACTRRRFCTDKIRVQKRKDLYGFFHAGIAHYRQLCHYTSFHYGDQYGTVQHTDRSHPPYIAFGLPTSILIAGSYIRGIPDALVEAAVIDGASYTAIFWKIVLVISTPVIATIAVLSFLGNWNEFLLVFTLTSGQNMRSLPVSINSFAGRLNQDYGLQFAALVIGTIPMFVFYVFAHNSLVKGFGEGAIKE